MFSKIAPKAAWKSHGSFPSLLDGVQIYSGNSANWINRSRSAITFERLMRFGSNLEVKEVLMSSIHPCKHTLSWLVITHLMVSKLRFSFYHDSSRCACLQGWMETIKTSWISKFERSRSKVTTTERSNCHLWGSHRCQHCIATTVGVALYCLL